MGENGHRAQIGMSDNEPRAPGVTLHRGLQWASTILTGLLVAFAVSGIETWDRLKEQSIRMENVPSDITEIKIDLGDVKNETMNLKWKVSNLETTKPKRP